MLEFFTLLLAVATVWMAGATLKMARQTRLSRLDAVRPELRANVKRSGNNQAILELQNVGLGPALDLEVTVNGTRIHDFLGHGDSRGLNGTTWLFDAVPAGESVYAVALGPRDECQSLLLDVRFRSMLNEPGTLHRDVRIAPQHGQAYFPDPPQGS